MVEKQTKNDTKYREVLVCSHFKARFLIQESQANAR